MTCSSHSTDDDPRPPAARKARVAALAVLVASPLSGGVSEMAAARLAARRLAAALFALALFVVSPPPRRRVAAPPHAARRRPRRARPRAPRLPRRFPLGLRRAPAPRVPPRAHRAPARGRSRGPAPAVREQDVPEPLVPGHGPGRADARRGRERHVRSRDEPLVRHVRPRRGVVGRRRADMGDRGAGRAPRADLLLAGKRGRDSRRPPHLVRALRRDGPVRAKGASRRRVAPRRPREETSERDVLRPRGDPVVVQAVVQRGVLRGARPLRPHPRPGEPGDARGVSPRGRRRRRRAGSRR